MGRALQRDLRSAISIAYELLRHEHILKRDGIAETLGDLESELARIEAKLGGPRRGEIAPSSLDPWMKRVEAAAREADPVVAGQIRALVESLRDIQRDLAEAAPRRSWRSAAIFLGAMALGAIATLEVLRRRRAAL